MWKSNQTVSVFVYKAWQPQHRWSASTTFNRGNCNAPNFSASLSQIDPSNLVFPYQTISFPWLTDFSFAYLDPRREAQPPGAGSGPADGQTERQSGGPSRVGHQLPVDRPRSETSAHHCQRHSRSGHLRVGQEAQKAPEMETLLRLKPAAAGRFAIIIRHYCRHWREHYFVHIATAYLCTNWLNIFYFHF